MAYVKNTWVDQEVERPKTYEITNNADGSVTLTDSFGLVSELGTPVNSDNMNHIEEGIAGCAIRKYNVSESFEKDEWVTDVVDFEKKIYNSLKNNNLNHPVTDEEWWEEVKIGGSGTSLPLFTPILQDRILTYEETKGYALQGTWVYSTAIAGERFGYPTFVNVCLQQYNEATPSTITSGGTTINVRKHSNGHIFFNAETDMSQADAIFNATGEAWYYGIDATNKRVFMPRTKLLFSDTQTSVASTIPSSPSVFGNGKALVYLGAQNNTSYLQYWTETDNHKNNHPVNNTTNPPSNNYNALTVLSGEGSWTSVGNKGATIGLATKAQANAQGLNHAGLVLDTSGFKVTSSTNTITTEKQSFFYYYIVVGNTVSDTSWIDVVTEVEGGVKDIEDAADAQIARIQQEGLDGYVQKTGDTMSGTLQNNVESTSIHSILSTVITDQAPSYITSTRPANVFYDLVSITFPNWDRFVSRVEANFYDNGNHAIGFSIRKNADENTHKTLLIGYTAEGTAYTSAPTPASTSNNDNIATTKWVKALPRLIETWESQWFTIAKSASLSWNLASTGMKATNSIHIKPEIIAKVITADANYAVGDIVYGQWMNYVGTTGSSEQGSSLCFTGSTLTFSTGNSFAWGEVKKGGGQDALVHENVQLKIILRRFSN